MSIGDCFLRFPAFLLVAHFLCELVNGHGSWIVSLVFPKVHRLKFAGTLYLRIDFVRC